MAEVVSDDLRKQLAPKGRLRAGINVANFLLVSGKSSTGDPEGLAPDIAAEVAKRLGVAVEYVSYPNPKELGDAVDSDAWDIGLIGAEPQRAATIAFTAAYVEIPVTYMVAPGSIAKSVADVDAAGMCIASVAGSAFGLWLESNIKHAKVEQARSMDDALEQIRSGKANVLAGLKQRLSSDVLKVPGATILDGHFMTVQQAIGAPRGRSEAAVFLANAVEDLKSSGFVAKLIEKHQRVGQLMVPPAAPNRAVAAVDSGGDAKRRKLDENGRAASRNCKTIGILGCGAMGSVYAGYFAAAGHEVWAVDVWKEHVETIKQKGLRVEGPGGDRTVQVKASLDASDLPPCDLVVIATKASGVGAAAQAAAKLIKDGGVVLTIQNGLGAGDRIAQFINTSNVILGVASNFGACMKGPGHAEHKSMNLIALGELAGGLTERLENVVAMWSDAGFTAKACEDIQKMIWEKLICNVFGGGVCTLTGLTVGEMLDHPASKQVALSCAREADAVARARGIKLSFEDVQAYVEKFASTVRGARPSMAQDHAAKRKGEVDFIVGAIPAEAAKVGLSAPVCQTVADLIRARESTF